MTRQSFAALGLSQEILQATEAMGYIDASPIQTAAIPAIMQGQDVVGQSQTGSGKTAAFVIPALEKIDASKKVTQVLIMCPTRELAVQVSDEIEKLGKFKPGIRTAAIFGGASYDPQIRALKQGAQIVVGTPGRIIDHLERKTLQLNNIQMVILDEADRMLDMGFRDDMRTILKMTPATRQFICFSATVSREIQDLISTYARNPQHVQIEQKTMTATTVDQRYYLVKGLSAKREALTRLLAMHDYKLGIIFCNTKKMVDELADYLIARGYPVDRLHGDINQSTRTRVMGKFRNAQGELLIATDVAARGIDLDNVEVVINYDLPNDIENYVHRIGRTGRAGKSGSAISFVNSREMRTLRLIERYSKQAIHQDQLPSAEDVAHKRMAGLIESLAKDIATTPKAGNHIKLVEELLQKGFSAQDIAQMLMQKVYSRDIGAVHETSGHEESERPGREPRRRERSEREERPERSSNRRNRDTGPMKRLRLDIGTAHTITPRNVVGAILGETGLQPEIIGSIQMHPKHLFVDIAAEHVTTVVSALEKARIKGRRLTVEVEPS